MRVVIGIGNRYRRDDGVGIVAAETIAEQNLPGVRVLLATGEPGAMLDAWSGAELVVVVDAAVGDGLTPGHVRRWIPGDQTRPVVSSHALGLEQTYALGEALERIPGELVVLTVDAADTGNGVGLTPTVAAAVPGVVEAVLAELDR